MKNIIKTGIIITALLPLISLAQGGIEPITPKETNIQKVIDTVAAWATGLLVSLSVLFVIYAAYIYLTAAGDPEKVKHASTVIIYAAVSIGVALLAQVVKTVVRGLIQ